MNDIIKNEIDGYFAMKDRIDEILLPLEGFEVTETDRKICETLRFVLYGDKRPLHEYYGKCQS